MVAGVRGVFVIPWDQVEVDARTAPPLDALRRGATLIWRGELSRIDGPSSVMRLGAPSQPQVPRGRCAIRAQRLAAPALAEAALAEGAPAPVPGLPPLLLTDPQLPGLPDTLEEGEIEVTDGARLWRLTVLGGGTAAPPLLRLPEDFPPRGRELWITRHRLSRILAARRRPERGLPGGLMAETQVATPRGPRAAGDLRPGDFVLTRDAGAQEVLWTSLDPVSGARQQAMPHLRPVRLPPGALGKGRPLFSLRVAPGQRVLLRGDKAMALFGQSDVLIAADDLVGAGLALRAEGLRPYQLVTVMLAGHHLLRAGGMEVASFHPGYGGLSGLSGASRARFLADWPELAEDPERFGPPARRLLSRPEAVILAGAA